MIECYEGSYCGVMSGYFQKNCENIDWNGADKWTVCPKGKFWVGIDRPGGAGLDHLKFRCCEAEYQEPLQELPKNYQFVHDRFSFQLDKRWEGKWLRSVDKLADFKS